MNEDESVSEFHIRLCDIANTSFTLSKKMPEESARKKEQWYSLCIKH